jgi:hypothetical protein
MLSGTTDFVSLIRMAVAGRMGIDESYVVLGETQVRIEEKRAVKEVLIDGEKTGVFYDMSVPVDENNKPDVTKIVDAENRKIDDIVSELTLKGY